MIKLLLLLSLMGLASIARAAPVIVCTGGAPQTAVQQFQPYTQGFVIMAFLPRCSNNVILSGEDNRTFFAAASASVKGNNVYMGSTANGDMVIYNSKCPAYPCNTNDVGEGQVRASLISS